MKFQKIHLFIILLLALIFCSCLGSFMREGMENKEENPSQKRFDKRFNASINEYEKKNFDKNFDNAVNKYEKKQAKEEHERKIQEATENLENAYENAIEESILNEYAMGQYPSSASTTASSKVVNGNSYEEVYGNKVVVDRQPQNTINVGGNSQGVSRSSIPQGQEDLYILKSEIVPPVCPACPQQLACPRQEKCPPCPACARCPEPAFECKKVPNYSSSNDQYLPRPVLADFSQFGM